MPVIIAMLRAVNVGGRNKMKMDELRRLIESLGHKNPQTYIQSGNVVFDTSKRDLATLSTKIEEALEVTFGFRPGAVLRTLDELNDVVEQNPFAARSEISPDRLLVRFLARDPGEEARGKVLAMKIQPEELRIEKRELFVYYPDGMGRSKLPVAAIDKVLNTVGTTRNWNTVLKLRNMAAELVS